MWTSVRKTHTFFNAHVLGKNRIRNKSARVCVTYPLQPHGLISMQWGVGGGLSKLKETESGAVLCGNQSVSIFSLFC